MKENKIMMDLIEGQYFMSLDRVRTMLDKMSTLELILLKYIKDSTPNNKSYVTDIQNYLQINSRRLREIITKLRDKGFLIWTHDGDGEEGTYVIITEEGKLFLEKEMAQLESYYSTVIESYGKEEMETLIQMLKKLRNIMKQTKMKGENDGY